MAKNREELMKRIYGHYDYRKEIEVRAKEAEAEDDEFYYLEGKAVTFDEATTLYRGSFMGEDYEIREIITREAFEKTDMSDVFLKYNHSDDYMACARTKNKTLELEVREDGVYMKAKLSKRISAAVDLYEGVRSGLIDKMSFAFTIAKDGEEVNERTEDGVSIVTYTVRGIDKMYDVAAVNVPAYDNTSIYARRIDDAEARHEAVEAEKLERMRSQALARLNTALKK